MRSAQEMKVLIVNVKLTALFLFCLNKIYIEKLSDCSFRINIDNGRVYKFEKLILRQKKRPLCHNLLYILYILRVYSTFICLL